MSPAQALHAAIQSGDEARIAELLDADASLVHGGGAAGMPPLLRAAYSGKRAIAAMLIARGAVLDQFAAAALGHVTVLRELLSGPDKPVNLHSSDGWTALHLACFFGQFDCVEALLELGASVKMRSANTMGNAPLHAAAAGRHREICALLLSHNAEVTAEQAGLYTPLHAAAASGDEDLVRLLLAHEANTKAKSEKGETALDMARARNHAGVVARLERIGQ
jgi:ankyrin repeat protein